MDTDVAVRIGSAAQFAGAARFFNGRIAEVGLWRAVLSADEILSASQGVSPSRIRPGALIGYWPIWGVASPEPDLSDLGNHGTVTGTAPAADHAPVGRPYFGAGLPVGPARVTQVPVEALATGDPDARVTHIPVEALATGDPKARVTHEPVEVLDTGDPKGRVTHIPVEVLDTGDPRGRVTQETAETVILPPPPPARLTQMPVEVIMRNLHGEGVDRGRGQSMPVGFPATAEITTFDNPLNENPLSQGGTFSALGNGAPPLKYQGGSAVHSVENPVNYSYYTAAAFRTPAIVEVWACTEGGQLGAALETWRVRALA